MNNSLNRTISIKISKNQEDELKKFGIRTGVPFRKLLFISINPTLSLLDDMFKEAGYNKNVFQKALFKRGVFEIGGHSYGILINALPSDLRDEYLKCLSIELQKNMKGGEEK